MADQEKPGIKDPHPETGKAREKEGHGTVPNVTAGDDEGATGELKKAMHDLEEEKGDWSKDR